MGDATDIVLEKWPGGKAAQQRAEAIEDVIRGPKHRLRFPADLEAKFEQETSSDRCRVFVRYGLLGFVLCNMFMFNYFRLLPDIAVDELVGQLTIVAPVVLGVTFYTLTKPPVLQREMAQIVAAVIGLVVPMIAYQGSHYPAAVFFRYSPILTLLYINVVTAVRFRFALPASAVVVLCNLVDLSRLGGVSSDVKGFIGASVLTACGFTLLANHRLEREQRRAYLLNEREGLQRDEIIRLLGEQAHEAARLAQERERAALATAAHAAELRDAHRIARIATWRMDFGARAVSMPDELHKLLGTDCETFTASEENLLSLIHPEDRAATVDAFSRAVNGEKAVQQEWRILRSDGSVAWFWSEMHLEKDAAGRAAAVRGVCKDVTEYRITAERIYRLAHHDPLTGVANRSLLHERISQAVDRSRQAGGRLAILCFDLDGFKAVNDVYGHGAGDKLLCEVAARLCRSVRESDTVARLGGDEFVVLHEETGQSNTATTLAERLVEALRAPYDVGVGETRSLVTASIGVAQFPTHGEDAETLLHNADTALYQAKWKGKNQAAVFNPDMDSQLRERRALEHDLHQAVARGEFQLVWQPISSANLAGEVTGFEVLLRWHHPQRGTIPPDTFIPVAEACGAIWAIGFWVLQEACREAARWAVPLRVAVNVSPLQAQEGEAFAAMVEQVLASTGLEPARLILEVTEGVLIRRAAEVLCGLRRLRALGVQTSLDDFGTGYSSFATLRAFPFDQIKIDRSFVAGMTTASDGQDMAIVHAVLGLARGLGVPVVAEGVETETQFSALREAGCEEVQGWLIGRPACIESFVSITRTTYSSPATLSDRHDQLLLQNVAC